jgi:hypothetical protein
MRYPVTFALTLTPLVSSPLYPSSHSTVTPVSARTGVKLPELISYMPAGIIYNIYPVSLPVIFPTRDLRLNNIH